uniref:Uncharacterized protein n=1 Tax=Kalanchoe fedtschenkoi TaxID=63787 RepID=A0A7N0UTW4_KALFE
MGVNPGLDLIIPGHLHLLLLCLHKSIRQLVYSSHHLRHSISFPDLLPPAPASQPTPGVMSTTTPLALRFGSKVDQGMPIVQWITASYFFSEGLFNAAPLGVL